MPRAKDKPEFEENVETEVVELLSGNFGSKWYAVSHQQKKIKTDDGKFLYKDDLTRPKVFILGQGKRVLQLSFEEILEFKKLIEDQREYLTGLLAEERLMTRTDETF